MANNWTNFFTSAAVKPSEVSYESLSIAANTALLWPTETLEGQPYVASQIDVTATATSLQLQMPNAKQGATGPACVVSNVGTNSFTVTDTGGNSIATIAAAQSWIITLTDNSTTNGTWRALQLAATTSNAQASSLADSETTQAIGSALSVFMPANYFSTSQTLTAAERGSVNVWTGNVGTFTLDTIAHLTAGWFAFVSNQGVGDLTLLPPNGATINGGTSVVIPPDVSQIVECNANGFLALGGFPLPIPVAGGGTGATNPSAALANLGGTTTGIAIFNAASAAAVVSLLGLSTVQFSESTINTSQTLTSASSLTAFVATAALTLTLPLTTGLNTKFTFAVYAQGGSVTITPNAADKVNNGSAGANFSVPSGQSALFVTDANGNWWPLYLSASGTVSSVALSMPGEFVVTNSPVTTSGTLTVNKATQNANTIYAGPASGGAAAPTFRALQAADIPAANGQTRTTLTSGSSQTYTTPVGATRLFIRFIGGGGSGASVSTAGGNGLTTTFNAISAAGGSGGLTGNAQGGAGGSGGTGVATLRLPGSAGGVSTSIAGLGGANGGQGAPGIFGTGAGSAGSPGVGPSGGGANTGAGGGGQGNASSPSGGTGGGGGEYVELIINSPSATYTYTVGGGGAAPSGAGGGGSGIIIIDEFYD